MTVAATWALNQPFSSQPLLGSPDALLVGDAGLPAELVTSAGCRHGAAAVDERCRAGGERGRLATELRPPLHRQPGQLEHRAWQAARIAATGGSAQPVEGLLERGLARVVPDRVGPARLADGQREGDCLGQVVDIEGKHATIA